MKKVDFFSKAIDFKGSLLVPCYQAWSRAYKKVGPLKSIASNQEKSAARGAKKGPFCMGILVTLSLSKKKAPIGLTNIFVDKVVSEYPYELKFKRIGKKGLLGLHNGHKSNPIF